MSTTFDNAAIQFLAEKENFKFALEVADRIDAVKRHLLLSFWDTLGQRINEELVDDLGAGKGWLIKSDNQMDGKFSGITLFPTNIIKPRFCFKLEREVNFYHGIVAPERNAKSSEILAIPEVSLLLNELSEKQFTHEDYWLGWRYSDKEFTNNNRIYIEIAENACDFSNRIISSFINDFYELKSHIQKINQLTST
jgi:hypothetical protein